MNGLTEISAQKLNPWFVSPSTNGYCGAFQRQLHAQPTPRRVSNELVWDGVANGATSHMEPSHASVSSKVNHFPYKLYEMLEFCANMGLGSIVSWTPDGLAFIIRDKKQFLERIVPIFFKQTRFRSFTRQLNLWGFTRNTSDTQYMGAWQRQYFVRGNRGQLERITRIKIKGEFKLKDSASKTSEDDVVSSVSCNEASPLMAPVACSSSVALPTTDDNKVFSYLPHSKRCHVVNQRLSSDNEPTILDIRPLVPNKKASPLDTQVLSFISDTSESRHKSYAGPSIQPCIPDYFNPPLIQSYSGDQASNNDVVPVNIVSDEEVYPRPQDHMQPPCFDNIELDMLSNIFDARDDQCDLSPISSTDDHSLAD